MTVGRPGVPRITYVEHRRRGPLWAAAWVFGVPSTVWPRWRWGVTRGHAERRALKAAF